MKKADKLYESNGCQYKKNTTSELYLDIEDQHLEYLFQFRIITNPLYVARYVVEYLIEDEPAFDWCDKKLLKVSKILIYKAGRSENNCVMPG